MSIKFRATARDVSSAMSGIYAAGTATMDLLGLSYVASEAGIPFPNAITLQVDNAPACEAYANQTRYSGRSRSQGYTKAFY